MPVYIFDPDAFEKLVAVEGEEYRRLGTKESLGDYSFEAFKESWYCLWKRNFWFPSHRPIFPIHSGPFAVSIYGWWGWHRYAVYNSGEIRFILGFEISKEHVRKTKEVGFRFLGVARN